MKTRGYRIFKIIVLVVLLGIIAYNLIKGETGSENPDLLRHVFRIIRHL